MNSRSIDRDDPADHPSENRQMRIILVPLDERPVNVDIPRQVAAIAGVDIEIPSGSILPNRRSPADVGAIHAWMLERAGRGVSHLIACIDTVVHGGIIPSRITESPARTTLERLDVFRSLKASSPALSISAVSLIMRASDSYSAVEEPEYWSRHGRELHRLGADLHRALERDAAGESVPVAPDDDIPQAIVRDFEIRRLRNHLINLSALELHEEGVIETLALTTDDTAPHSAGSAEQLWLRYWSRALPAGGSVLMYPGADEVGAVLVARALTTAVGPPAFTVACGEAEGLNRVPNFENAPLGQSVLRQISAAGGRVTSPGEQPDIVVVVHAPDPHRGDFFVNTPASDPGATERTLGEVRKALHAGHPVALADVRFSNGGDPQLVDALAAEGLLLQLSSYGGWNTAGNSLGSAIAHSIACWAGNKLGTLDRLEAERALLTRILDDRVYQSGIRGRLHSEVFSDEIGEVSVDIQRRATELIEEALQSYIDQLAYRSRAWTVESVTLPWGRSFEISLRIEPVADAQ